MPWLGLSALILNTQQIMTYQKFLGAIFKRMFYGLLFLYHHIFIFRLKDLLQPYLPKVTVISAKIQYRPSFLESLQKTPKNSVEQSKQFVNSLRKMHNNKSQYFWLQCSEFCKREKGLREQLEDLRDQEHWSLVQMNDRTNEQSQISIS